MWVAATLIAALAQTGRNAAQAGLTAEIGTIGATAVRFLFGLPFAALFLVILSARTPLPAPESATWAWSALGALSQIAATAFMLATMRGQGFGVATALTKTEPVTLALFGALLLSEPLGPPRLAAILLTTLGVMLMSGAQWQRARLASIATGIIAGALFGLSAIGFRGAILSLPDAPALIRSAVVLVIALALQSLAMLAWLGWRDRAALAGIARHCRPSLAAGALGAFASLFWFIGFALTAAANVRTLALIEVIFAQILSARLFREGATARQLAGMALIMAGVALLIRVA
ncbi:EamA-like transporter family protein [Paracoccus isoporae]|uniref:EamA-like transporter family protein n=1 Tax=Paracoccus isoporae TaxID=591205 RepID=A0A1G6X3Y3_9RHOB|nr:DMT family transporter [Paracoccus isoporae]SDD72890.1 EamA-like transporter family protein [Paracoccus isoporae]